MPKQVQLIGVYALPVTDDLVAEQTAVLFGDEPTDDDIAQVRSQLASTVLVEVLVKEADESFDVGDFAQADPNLPRENWQVAWAEAYLNENGDELLCDRWDSPSKEIRTFRVAFFVHCWKDSQPIMTSDGELLATAPMPMPERLARLVPYECVD